MCIKEIKVWSNNIYKILQNKSIKNFYFNLRKFAVRNPLEKVHAIPIVVIKSSKLRNNPVFKSLNNLDNFSCNRIWTNLNKISKIYKIFKHRTNIIQTLIVNIIWKIINYMIRKRNAPRNCVVDCNGIEVFYQQWTRTHASS